MTKKKLTFEAGMQELEEIVRDLEQGNMPLEDAFEAFEKAKKLQESLRAMLDDGDRRIRLLTESGTEEIEPEES